MSFQSTKVDTCVFVKWIKGEPLIIVIDVDDGLFVCDIKKQKEQVFRGLTRVVEIKDMSFPKVFLGTEYVRGPIGISFSSTGFHRRAPEEVRVQAVQRGHDTDYQVSSEVWGGHTITTPEIWADKTHGDRELFCGSR
jgi:hypothetical protein